MTCLKLDNNRTEFEDSSLSLEPVFLITTASVMLKILKINSYLTMTTGIYQM